MEINLKSMFLSEKFISGAKSAKRGKTELWILSKSLLYPRKKPGSSPGFVFAALRLFEAPSCCHTLGTALAPSQRRLYP
jgi:hypothetical protein